MRENSADFRSIWTRVTLKLFLCTVTCTSGSHNVTTMAANLKSCYLEWKTNNGCKRAAVTGEAATSGPLSTKRTCWIKVTDTIKVQNASLHLSSGSPSCSAPHSSGTCPNTEAGSSHDDISFACLKIQFCFIFFFSPTDRHMESRLRTLTCPDMQRRIAVDSLVTRAELTVVSTSSH